MAGNQSFMASQSHSSYLNESVERSGEMGGAGTGGGGGETGQAFAGRKEQVWCEQAVWSLLNVYEEKWRQLEWGNLRGKHWEEVSASLNSFGNGQWPAKAPMQCKNKIEDLKKKYKEKVQKGGSLACSTSASGGSKWPYYSRMEVMFKNAAKGVGIGLENGNGLVGGASNEQMNNMAGCLRFEFEENDNEEGDEENEESEEEEEVSFNVNSSSLKRKFVAGVGGGNMSCSKQRRSSVNEMVSVVRALGEALLRIENSKLEGQRLLIQMQSQAEARRVEMELKRTEMFLNTQVQLAKLVSDSMKSNN